jgi:preprotein translocase subunit SecD
MSLTLAIVRRRAEGIGLAETAVTRTGPARFAVRLPSGRDAREVVARLTAPGRLQIADWEPNVLDAQCATNPRRVNGGEQPIRGRAAASRRAARCSGRVSVVRAVDERGPGARGALDRWWVIRNRPVIGNRGVVGARQAFEGGPGGRPVVVLRLSTAGGKALAALSRRVAKRGAAASPGTPDSSEAIAVSHHLTIRIDDELISTPYINFREHPDGLGRLRALQIGGGFTVRAAKAFAARISSSPLPRRVRHVDP